MRLFRGDLTLLWRVWLQMSPQITDAIKVMHRVCRCACTLHGRHLTSCHVQDFFPPLSEKRRAWITSTRCQTSITHPPSSSQGRGHTDSPDRRPGSRAALNPSLPLGFRTRAARPPGRRAAKRLQLSARTHRPDVAVRRRPQLARSVLSHIHPPAADGRDSYYISHAPTSQINKQSRARPRAPPVILFFVVVVLTLTPSFFLLLSFYLLIYFLPGVGLRCTHPPLASAR